MPLTIHRAERADVLAGGLAQLLAQPPEDPFEHDLVVVAANGVERWLAQTISHRLGTADGREDGICAGIDFVRPAYLISDLTDRQRDDPWAPGRLAWTVLDVVDEAIDEEWLQIVARHVGRGMDPADEALRRSRRYSTARRTASLLHGYAVQRPWMVQEWDAGNDTDGLGRVLPQAHLWQAEVWRRASQRLAGWPSPDRRLQAAAAGLRDGSLDPDLPQRLSFVGHTRMPAAELDVVAALGERRAVHLWLPHPSRVRWEAPTSSADKGSSAGGRVERAAVEVPETGNAFVTASARDVTELQHALLALPIEPVVEHLPSPGRPDTLLGQLQRDLADDVDGGAGRELDADDASVQVHACHGPARQVDVLREVVVGLLADDPTLEPRDVLVMCPDVETYAPLIEAAFGLDDVEGIDHPGHQLRVRLADRAAGTVNPVAEVLRKVVAIAAGRRTSVTEVRDLLGLAPVRRRFGFSDDDLEQIDEWTVATAVRWGLSAEARGAWGLDGLEQNTWRAGLDRLLTGVAVAPEDQDGPRPGGVLPVDDLASTGVDLVGRLSEAVARLGHVLEAAARPASRADWLARLTHAVRALTDTTYRDAWQTDQVLRGLADLAAPDHDGSQLTVVEIGALLDELFAARPTRANFRTGSLTVCTMVPMRSVPHRVVCLLGLDGDSFPRTPTPLGDDVLARHPLVGERDAAAEDRQLFLDAVLSATEHLVITYTGASEHTGREVPPATPVGEFLDQLERTAPGARDHVLVHHPLQAFDPRSFVVGGIVPGRAFSFDRAGFAGARALGRPTERPQPLLAEGLPVVRDDVVTLDELRSFVTHPVREFFRTRLDVTLVRDAEAIDDAIPLTLDALEQWEVKGRVLESVLAGADGFAAEADVRRLGLLPPGQLGDDVLEDLRQDLVTLVTLAQGFRDEPATSRDLDVVLPDGRRVVGTVTDLHPRHGLRVTPSKVQGARLTTTWVDVLALAAAGHPVPFRLVGRVGRGFRYGPGVGVLSPPSPSEAIELLAELLDLRALGLAEPLPLPIRTSQALADGLRTNKPQVALKAAEREWVSDRFKGFMKEDDDPYHVLAFGPEASLRVLQDRGMDQHALRLWTPLLDRWELQ